MFPGRVHCSQASAHGWKAGPEGRAGAVGLCLPNTDPAAGVGG